MSVGTAREFRSAKILCTVGPASRDPAVFRGLVDAGMDAVRINFSHTSHEEAEHVVRLTREVSAASGRPLAILADLQGPKIRLGELTQEVRVPAGGTVLFLPEGRTLRKEHPEATARVGTTYAGLAADLSPGDRVLIDDGQVAFEVRSIDGDAVVAEAIEGGTLRSRKGLNLPGVELNVPNPTVRDLQDVKVALALGVDYVALSFVRRPEEIQALRDAVGDRARVIAKIEKREAVERLDSILAASDGLMIARGDLGVELDFEEVPVVQKRILRLTRESTSLGITATQMLESMVRAPRPTRAEVSDVANALLDGTDAVMLSAETAAGGYPTEAVRAMCRVIRRIEKETGFVEEPSDTVPPPRRAREHRTVAGAIAGAAAEATARLRAPFLVTLTRSGFTAALMSAQRPRVPILAVTDQPRTYQSLALVWGVVPVLYSGEVSYDGMLAAVRELALREGYGRESEAFVVTAGVPFHVPGTTNYMRIETL